VDALDCDFILVKPEEPHQAEERPDAPLESPSREGDPIGPSSASKHVRDGRRGVLWQGLFGN
jgi:hypothetical protein